MQKQKSISGDPSSKVGDSEFSTEKSVPNAQEAIEAAEAALIEGLRQNPDELVLACSECGKIGCRIGRQVLVKASASPEEVRAAFG